MSETPAVEGAKRGHIECEVNVDSLAYWNYPQGTRDQEFRSPFAAEVRHEANLFDFPFVIWLTFTISGR